MTQEQIDVWSRLGEQEAAASLPFNPKLEKRRSS